MKMCVTGATGYLGSAVVEFMKSHGHEVIALSSKTSEAGNLYWRLGDELPAEAAVATETLIHCAYDFLVRTRAEVFRRNVDGSLRLFASAASQGIQKFIFISSMAAFEGCCSIYGQGKLEVEKRITAMGGISVRPGTIYGGQERGIVGNMRALIRRFRLVPLLGYGNPLLFLVHMDALCEQLLELVENYDNLCGQVLEVHEPAAVTLRELVVSLSAQEGRKVLLLPVPASLVWCGLRVLETLGMNPSLKSDSVVSLCYPHPKIARS